MAHESLNKDYILHTLCKEGSYEKVKEFIPTCKSLYEKLTCHRGRCGHTPLHEAVSKGHSEVLELLLHHGGDVNCRANNGYTPLHLAAENGYVECVRVLLMYNADTSATDESGKSPMQVAESSSKYAVVKALKSAGKCIPSNVLRYIFIKSIDSAALLSMSA